MANAISIERDHVRIELRSNGVLRGCAIASLCDLEAVLSVHWVMSAQGYAVGRHKPTGKVVKMNRFLLIGAGNDPRIIDHINRNRLDNRRENLRICTQSDNSKNTSIQKNNTSGSKGVSRSFNGTRWRARIWVGRREIHLGVFDTKEEAEIHYDDAAEILHGEYASTNKGIKPCARLYV